MESRLPKPSGIARLQRPPVVKAVLEHNETIAPMIPSRPKMTAFGGNIREPLGRDIFNLPNLRINRVKRAGSPELSKTHGGSAFIRATKMRRSRSACDLREAFQRPLKRMEPTLAPIPAKSSRLANVPPKPVLPKATQNLVRPNVPKTRIRANNTASSTNSLSSATAATSVNKPPAKPVVKRIPPYDFKARYHDLLEKHKALKEKYERSAEQIESRESLIDSFETKIRTLTETTDKAVADLELVQARCDQLTTESEKRRVHIEALTAKTNKLEAENVHLSDELIASREQLFQANCERKDLHNAVMDLRGNIRVFCRVRPPLESEQDRTMCFWSYLDEQSLEITANDLQGAKNKSGRYDFSFDHVFHPQSRQHDVFELVSPLIQSALDGYNICIFAYGQTGSGKTFTMDGTGPNLLGVIPRTVDVLFEWIANYRRLGWTYEVRATFLEIYNETLYDLLSNEYKDMEIRMVSAKNKTDVYVTNLTEETVADAAGLKHFMQIARMNRATASTVNNERSSRSHAVTCIKLIGTHIEKNETCVGTINLVDLAGSESAKTSVRMEETKKINRSLSELGNVIMALLQKDDHVPYRNSKLTHLLMPSLGGNSKTLMFINVSPFQDCLGETVKSLRFAAMVNSCKLTKAKRNKFLSNI